MLMSGDEPTDSVGISHTVSNWYTHPVKRLPVGVKATLDVLRDVSRGITKDHQYFQVKLTVILSTFSSYDGVEWEMHEMLASEYIWNYEEGITPSGSNCEDARTPFVVEIDGKTVATGYVHIKQHDLIFWDTGQFTPQTTIAVNLAI